MCNPINLSGGKFVQLLLVCAFLCRQIQTELSPDPNHDVTILSPTKFYVGQSNLVKIQSRQLVTKLTVTTSHDGISDFSFTIDPQPINQTLAGLYQYDIDYQIPYQSGDNPNLQVRVNFLVRLCQQTDCRSTKLVNLTETKTIISPTLLVLGETDKPIYRPGELIRIRFLAFSPNALSKSKQPDLTLVWDDDGKAVLKKSDSSLVNKPGFGYPIDQITITNPNGDHVKQWLKPTALQAANLSFQLLPDAEQGIWSIQAKYGHQTEMLKITVKKYVLPRFLISIEPPKQLFTDSKEAVFSVCAKYTNGQPMKGMAHVSFCICNTYDLARDFDFDDKDDDDDNSGRYYARQRYRLVRANDEREPKRKLEEILDTQTCPKGRYEITTRPCLTRNQALLSDGCTTLNISIQDYLKEEKHHGYYLGKPIICANVEEQGTGSSVSKCEVGSQVRTKERNLKLDFPTVYRPGLPIQGRIRLQGDLEELNPAGRLVKVIVGESHAICDWYRQSSSENRQNVYVTNVRLDSQGLATVFIPPIHQIMRVRIQAHLIDQDPVQPQNPTGPNALFIRLPYPPLIPTTDHFMEPWASLDRAAIQIWSEDIILKPTCPGQLKLKLLANRPLANKMLFVESSIRRNHLSVSFPPDLDEQSDQCRDRNDQLGHYKCLSPNSNAIECLDGWQGNDCLKPICAAYCDKRGGMCSQPGECLCKPGWNGTNCDQCIMRPGCKNGKCVKGDDCVCEPGWRGYNCAQKVVSVEVIADEDEQSTTEQTNEVGSDEMDSVTPLPEEEETAEDEEPVIFKPNRTLFEREITLELDSRWGPEANVVLYFTDLNNDGTNIVATSFRMEGMTKCTSNAIAVQQESGLDGLTIQPKSADPGSKVQLKIVPHVLTTDQPWNSEPTLTNASDVCFVRISDTALDNFGGSSKNLVNFAYYAGKVKHYGSTDSDFYRMPESNSEAFRMAGLHLSTSYFQAVLRPSIKPCVFASMARSGPPGPPGAVNIMNEALTMVDGRMSKMVEKPRLRDFFPEVWLFDVYPVVQLSSDDRSTKKQGVQLDLTVPDTVTTWRASSFCTTQNNGLFIAEPQTLLISMPFFIELTIPKEAKRGEILHLPLSVFVYDRPVSDQSNRSRCYEVSLTIELDLDDWLRIGADKYTGCVCTGEKQTFIMSLMPKRLGKLNVTAEAYALSDSLICGSDDSNQTKPLADRIRRSITVVPEGVAAETSVGDILCLNDNQNSMKQSFPLNLPSTIVPGSLRTYVSYSDEVLGPALVNLDNLVRLPTGCGEQNMVLVAPNVFVLDYLLSTSQPDSAKYKNLIQKARSHIEKGYRQQLKYRRSDGSFSAWGESDQSGSTWLTAFVLRVFHKATQLGLTFNFDQKLLFDDAVQYLLNQQDPLTGCFLENGRVIHEGMQGSVGSKGSHVLLTTYVSAVLWPIIPKDKDLTKLRNQTLERVFSGCLRTTEAVDWSNVSTSVLVQYAHNMALINTDLELSTKLVELIRERSQTTDTGGMHKMYWAREVNPTNPNSYGALDIETTAYAYLTLAKAGLSSSELFPIVRWLSSQQKAQGGFHSTQDTVLGLEVISDFAKRLGLSKKQSSNQNDLEVSFAIEPLGFSKTDQFTQEHRGYLNRQQIPVEDPDQVALSLWGLKSKYPTDRECLAVQIALLYNLPDPVKKDQAHFDMTTSITQSMIHPEDKSCTKASMLVCIRPKLGRQTSDSELETGMLLISVTMVTGWTASDELVSSHINSSSSPDVRRIEIGDNGQISVYFDGFSQSEADQLGGWNNVKRCVNIAMHQTVYIEDAKPGLITARDYYMTEKMIEASYLLDECREAWHIDARPVNPPKPDATTTPAESDLTPSTTTSPTANCPTCELDAQTKSQMADKLDQIRCHPSAHLMFIKPLNRDRTEINATVFQFSWGGMISAWNATINRTSLDHCKCEPLDTLQLLVVYSPRWLNIYAGDPVISLLKSSGQRDYVPFSTDDNSVFVLSASQVVPLVENLVMQWNSQKNDTKCTKNFETMIKYVKRKIIS